MMGGGAGGGNGGASPYPQTAGMAPESVGSTPGGMQLNGGAVQDALSQLFPQGQGSGSASPSGSAMMLPGGAPALLAQAGPSAGTIPGGTMSDATNAQAPTPGGGDVGASAPSDSGPAAVPKATPIADLTKQHEIRFKKETAKKAEEAGIKIPTNLPREVQDVMLGAQQGLQRLYKLEAEKIYPEYADKEHPEGRSFAQVVPATRAKVDKVNEYSKT